MLILAVKNWWNVRADGNRGWNVSDAIQISPMLRKHDISIAGCIEFIDAPLQKVVLRMHSKIGTKLLGSSLL